MRSIQTNPMIFMSDRLSVAFSFSRRAHLLTTPKGQWYLPLASRALSEGDCGCCGSLQTMPQPLRVLLSSSAQTAEHNHVCACAVGYYK